MNYLKEWLIFEVLTAICAIFCAIAGFWGWFAGLAFASLLTPLWLIVAAVWINAVGIDELNKILSGDDDDG